MTLYCSQRHGALISKRNNTLTRCRDLRLSPAGALCHAGFSNVREIASAWIWDISTSLSSQSCWSMKEHFQLYIQRPYGTSVLIKSCSVMQTAVRGSSYHNPAGSKGQLQVILHLLPFGRNAGLERSSGSILTATQPPRRQELTPESLTQVPKQENTTAKVYQDP